MPNPNHQPAAIRLRAMEPEDLDLLYQVENDDTLKDVGISNVPYSRFLIRQFIADSTGDIYTDKQVRLMICMGSTTVGMADLIDFNPQHLRAEVGIMVMQPYRQQGIAQEALRLLSQYAAQTLHLHQLYAYVGLDNLPSLQLFEKAGYRASATLRDWLFDGKKHHDVALMQLFL